MRTIFAEKGVILKTIIIEKEHYLAQNIAIGVGGESLIFEDAILANTQNFADILIITSETKDAKFLLEKFAKSVKILLISYENGDDTAQLKAMCDDFIYKPFAMGDLLRKIARGVEFRKLKLSAFSSKIFINQRINFKLFSETTSRSNAQILNDTCAQISAQIKAKIGVIITTNNLSLSANFAYFLADSLKMGLNFLNSLEFDSDENSLGSDVLSLFFNFDALNLQKKSLILSFAKSHPIIVLSTDFDSNFGEICGTSILIKKLEFSQSEIAMSDIISIENHIKFTAQKYENLLSETQIATALGISRKSLWQKRKQFGIKKRAFATQKSKNKG